MSDLIWVAALFITALTIVNLMLLFSMLKMYTEIFKHDAIQRRHQ